MPSTSIRSSARSRRKGYQETKSGDVNYLLSYEVGVNSWISRTDARSVGSVSLSLVDAAYRRRVWLGFVRAEVDTSLTRQERTQLFREELREMLKDFPPSQPR